MSDIHHKQPASDARQTELPQAMDSAMELSCVWPKEFESQVILAGPHLIRAAEMCIDEIDVQLSVIRTLSILSEHDGFCDAIADISGRLAIIFGPILCEKPNKSTQQSADIDIATNKALGLFNRIGYILGNVMTYSDSARIAFYNNDAAIEYLLQSLVHYASKNFMVLRRKSIVVDDEMPSGDDPNAGQMDTVIDVLIKLIRVVANLSVNADVGYKLANYHQLGAVFLTLLHTINAFQQNFVRTFLRF